MMTFSQAMAEMRQLRPGMPERSVPAPQSATNDTRTPNADPDATASPEASSGTDPVVTRVARVSGLLDANSSLVDIGLLRVVEGGINWQSAGALGRAQP